MPRRILKEGHNIYIRECLIGTITGLASELTANKYRAMFLPIEGDSVAAQFFLERSPV